MGSNPELGPDAAKGVSPAVSRVALDPGPPAIHSARSCRGRLWWADDASTAADGRCGPRGQRRCLSGRPTSGMAVNARVYALQRCARLEDVWSTREIE
jgi:hypothetical protein